MYRQLFKRIIDFLFSLLGLILISPLLLVLTLILSFTNRGFPFFFQKRPGKNEKIFMIIKFKTMTDEVDPNGNLLPDVERITKLGNFVRKTSLDEIPQLLSVLKGDMSFVGPRPLLVKYLPLYNEFQRRRHEVKPGITGWAQVNGRNTVSWEERFAHDVYYVENISFLLDFKILVKTFFKVFKSDEINASDNDTMPAFTGNKS